MWLVCRLNSAVLAAGVNAWAPPDRSSDLTDAVAPAACSSAVCLPTPAAAVTVQDVVACRGRLSERQAAAVLEQVRARGRGKGCVVSSV